MAANSSRIGLRAAFAPWYWPSRRSSLGAGDPTQPLGHQHPIATDSWASIRPYSAIGRSLAIPGRPRAVANSSKAAHYEDIGSRR